MCPYHEELVAPSPGTSRMPTILLLRLIEIHSADTSQGINMFGTTIAATPAQLPIVVAMGNEMMGLISPYRSYPLRAWSPVCLNTSASWKLKLSLPHMPATSPVLIITKKELCL